MSRRRCNGRSGAFRPPRCSRYVPSVRVRPFSHSFWYWRHGLADVLHHGDGLAHFPCHEHIILAGEEEVLTGRIYVVLLDRRDVVHRAFSLVIFLLVHAIRQLGVIL